MPPTNNQEPITNNQQPPTNNQQQTTNNKQQTTNNQYSRIKLCQSRTYYIPSLYSDLAQA